MLFEDGSRVCLLLAFSSVFCAFVSLQQGSRQIYGRYRLLGQISVPQILYAGTETDEPEERTPEPEEPDVEYPGNDPTKAPSDDYEWRGKPPQGGKQGGYANKKGKDSWHPDLDHEGDIGPHWDYNDGNGNQWRVFPDGHIKLKM